MAFLILLLILAGVVIWLFLPGGERIEMKALVGPNSIAMVHVTDCSDDPGVVAMSESLSRIAREAQRMDLQQSLPDGLGGLSDLAMLSQGDWKSSYLPEVVLAMEDLTPSNEVFVVGAALDGLPKIFTLPIRMAVRHGGGGSGVSEYRGQSLLDSGDGWIAFFDATALYASDEPRMEQAVDRVLDGAPPNPLLELVPPSYAEQWDVYGIVRNHDGQIADRIRELEDAGAKVVLSIAAEVITEAWLGVDVMSDQQLRAELVMNCVDEASARTLANLIVGSLEEARSQIDDPMVDVVLTQEVSGDRAVLTAEIVGVSNFLENEWRATVVSPEPIP